MRPHAHVLLVPVVGWLGACYELSPPAPAVAPDLAPPPVAKALPASPPLPEFAEVEVMGRVQLPPGARGKVRTYITQGDCFSDGAVSLSEQSPPREFFADEVFVKQGTRLWVCAALLDERAQRKGQATIYGRAPGVPFVGQGVGEVMFTDLVITLAKGPPVSLPVRPATPPR